MFTKVTVGHLEVWEIQSVLKVTSCMLKGWVVLLEASVALRMEHQESTHKAFQVQLLALGWEEAIVTKTAESRSRTYSLEYIVLGVGNGLSLLIITVIYWTFNYKHCGELFFLSHSVAQADLEIVVLICMKLMVILLLQLSSAEIIGMIKSIPQQIVGSCSLCAL